MTLNPGQNAIALETTSAPAPKARIQFIDALRAYAILMMLQGHFVDTLLSEAHRDPENLLYNIWFFNRGLTAPIFFTVTGLVFVFLLLKDHRPLRENERVRKGIRRAFFLIFIAYALRSNLMGLLKLEIYPSGLATDVLHIIGVALLVLIGLYALHDRLRIPYPLLLGSVGLTIFYFSVQWKNADWSFLPVPIENYFTNRNGSVFILYPWIGYTLMGGILGWTVHRFRHWYQTLWWPAVLMTAGITLTFFSSDGFHGLFTITGLRHFETLATNYYVFWRLGHVMIVISLFLYLERAIKSFHPLFLKIGTETLTIYGVHYVILYGSLIGIGLSRFWYRSLDPQTVAAGALAFILAHVILIRYIEQVRAVPGFLRTALANGWRSQTAGALRTQLHTAWAASRRRTNHIVLKMRTIRPERKQHRG